MASYLDALINQVNKSNHLFQETIEKTEFKLYYEQMAKWLNEFSYEYTN